MLSMVSAESGDFLRGGCLRMSRFSQLAIWLEIIACSFTEQVRMYLVHSTAPSIISKTLFARL